MAFPWAIAASAGMGIVQSIFGGNQRNERNRAEREAAERQNRYNKELRDYNNRQGERNRDFQQGNVEINRRNQDKNIGLRQFQEDSQRDYQMLIRQINYDNEQSLQNEQIRIAREQNGFNAQGYASALLQQENYEYEQNLQLDLAYLDGFSKFEFDQRGLDLQQRGSRVKDNFDMQASQLEGLKSVGAQQAKGSSGRSAGKAVQAAIAENGMKQAMIAENTTMMTDQYRLSTEQNVKNLQTMSRDILLGRASLERNNKFSRQQLQQQLEQANAEAFNSIMLSPVLGPELPEVPNYADYAAEFQDIPEWEELPEPVQVEAQQEQGNFFTDFLGSSGGQDAIGMGINSLAGASVPQPPTDAPGTGNNNLFADLSDSWER